MNNKWLLLLLIPVVIILVIVIIFLVERSKVDFHEEDGTSISIIGGADGPTSIFIAGKIGGNDSESNIEAEETGKVQTEIQTGIQIEIQIGDATMIAELKNNEAASTLIGLLSSDEIVMSASNYGGFEKVCTTCKILPDSKLEELARKWSKGVDITFVSNHSSLKWGEENVSNFQKYSDNLISCDVYLEEQILVNGTGWVIQTYNNRLYFMYEDGPAVKTPGWYWVGQLDLTGRE